MANEFRHTDVGDELTRAEWEAVATHIANAQAAGDILYCDGTNWLRLAKGIAGQFLKTGVVPAWDAPAPTAHAASHQNGGADEVSVAGLSGELADNQPPKAHKASHQDGGADKISIAGLLGEPAELTTHKGLPSIHHTNLASVTFIIDGGDAEITTGEKGHLEVPFACTITRVTMIGKPSGSIVVDIWKSSYAAAPPDNADSITAAAPPTITTAEKSQDSTLTDWTTAIAAGDILAFNVDSITTIERVTISLKVEKA